ncbi:MAG TPA: Uma2 family endonuclease [Isosphaeraceae bacterium]|jgi:Uma2 family endonuclease
MSVGTHAALAEARDDVPIDRLYRLSDDQLRRMIDAGLLAADASDQLVRLSVAQYDEAIRLGILTENDPIELIEGWLVTKMSKNRPHSIATTLVLRVLSQLVPAGWYVAVQDPVATGDSEPEPDAMIVRGDVFDYPDRQPGAGNVGLLVEVAESTLAYDRSVKRRIYARAGVSTYWIVNLVDRQVEVHTEPSGPAQSPGYARREAFGPDAEIPVVLDGHEVGRVAVRDVLP